VDLETRKTVPLHSGDRVLTTSGEHALIRRDKALVWLDATSGSEKVLVDGLARLPGLLVEGAAVAVGSLVLDAASGRAQGSMQGLPVALTASGVGLVPEGGRASGDAFARGPLRWHSPTEAPHLE